MDDRTAPAEPERTISKGSGNGGAAAAAQRPFRLGLTDPSPVAGVGNLWRIAAQAATIGIFVVLFFAALYGARPVLMPATAAFVIGLMLAPVTSRADRAGVPTLLTAVVLWFAVIGVFYAVIVLLSQPVGDWISKAPEVGVRLHDKLDVFDRLRASFDDLSKALMPNAKGDSGIKFDIVSILQPAVLYVTPAIGELVIFFGTLFFYLVGRIRLRHVLVAFFDAREARLRMIKIMNDLEHNLTGYLSMVALINLVVGLAAGLIAYFVGLPNAVAWGLLGFILNFVPYIGALMMELILFGIGLVTFPTLTHAIIAPLLYLGFTTLEGHVVTPSIMGRRLTLNPLTVFLSLVFWTWLWGPVGAFLAVPILIVMLVVSSHLFPKEEPVLPT